MSICYYDELEKLASYFRLYTVLVEFPSKHALLLRRSVLSYLLAAIESAASIILPS